METLQLKHTRFLGVNPLEQIYHLTPEVPHFLMLASWKVPNTHKNIVIYLRDRTQPLPLGFQSVPSMSVISEHNMQAVVPHYYRQHQIFRIPTDEGKPLMIMFHREPFNIDLIITHTWLLPRSNQQTKPIYMSETIHLDAPNNMIKDAEYINYQRHLEIQSYINVLKLQSTTKDKEQGPDTDPTSYINSMSTSDSLISTSNCISKTEDDDINGSPTSESPCTQKSTSEDEDDNDDGPPALESPQPPVEIDDFLDEVTSTPNFEFQEIHLQRTRDRIMQFINKCTSPTFLDATLLYIQGILLADVATELADDRDNTVSKLTDVQLHHLVSDIDKILDVCLPH